MDHNNGTDTLKTSGDNGPTHDDSSRVDIRTWVHSSDNHASEKPADGWFVWRDILSHRPISKPVLSKDSPLDKFLDNIENNAPGMAVFLRHIFDDRILHLRQQLDAVIEEENALLIQHQNYLLEANERKCCDARQLLKEAEGSLALTLEIRNSLQKELVAADQNASKKAAFVGIPFVPAPIQSNLVEGMESLASENFTASEACRYPPDESPLEEVAQNSTDSQNFVHALKSTVTGAYAYIIEMKRGSEKKEQQQANDLQISHQNHRYLLQSSALKQRMSLREYSWAQLLAYTPSAYGEMRPIVDINAVAAEHGIPFYAEEEFDYQEERKRSEEEEENKGRNPLSDSGQLKTPNELRQLATHRRLRSPLIADRWFYYCTSAVGTLIGISLGLIFQVIKPEDFVRIEVITAKCVIFIPLGIGVAFTSRYAVMLPFLFAGEMHAISHFTNPPDKDIKIRAERNFIKIGIGVLIIVLLIDYSVEFGGIAQLVSNSWETAHRPLSITRERPMTVIAAQYLAPLIVLTGYLLYCAFEGFLRGRDRITHNFALALCYKRWQTEKDDKGLTQDRYREAVEAIHLYLSKQREYAVINYEIEQLRTTIKSSREVLIAPKPNAEMSARAMRRIASARADLIGAVRQFDELAEKTYHREIKSLENETLELEKKKAELSNQCEVIRGSINISKNLAESQAQTEMMREELTQDTIKNERHKVKLEESHQEVLSEIQIQHHKLEQEKISTDQLSEKSTQELNAAKAKTIQQREGIEQEKIAQEIKSIRNPPQLRRSFWQKIRHFWQS